MLPGPNKRNDMFSFPFRLLCKRAFNPGKEKDEGEKWQGVEGGGCFNASSNTTSGATVANWLKVIIASASLLIAVFVERSTG